MDPSQTWAKNSAGKKPERKKAEMTADIGDNAAGTRSVSMHLLYIQRQIEPFVDIGGKQRAYFLSGQYSMDDFDIPAVGNDHINAHTACDLCGLQFRIHTAGSGIAAGGCLSHLYGTS